MISSKLLFVASLLTTTIRSHPDDPTLSRCPPLLEGLIRQEVGDDPLHGSTDTMDLPTEAFTTPTGTWEVTDSQIQFQADPVTCFIPLTPTSSTTTPISEATADRCPPQLTRLTRDYFLTNGGLPSPNNNGIIPVPDSLPLEQSQVSFVVDGSGNFVQLTLDIDIDDEDRRNGTCTVSLLAGGRPPQTTTIIPNDVNSQNDQDEQLSSSSATSSTLSNSTLIITLVVFVSYLLY